MGAKTRFPDFRLSIDMKKFRKDIRQTNEGLEAVRKTMYKLPAGTVVVGPREPRYSRESRAPIHSMYVANILRKKGRDPFAYPDQLVNEIQKKLSDDGSMYFEEAFATGKSQKRAVIKLLGQCTSTMSRWVFRFVTKGGLGQKRLTKKKRALLVWMWKKGLVTDDYGFPPPYGILSGRFIASIRSKPQV